MKSLVILVAMNFASLALAATGKYSYKHVPMRDVDQYLIPGSDDTGTPEALQGLWWMDGNPLPDELMSFANVDFIDVVKNGEVVAHEGLLSVYDEGIWSWHDTDRGHTIYDLARKTRLNYRVVFNADYSHGVITPIVSNIWFLPPNFEVEQSPLLNFTMDRVSADEYSRDSNLIGKTNHYRFRRVVDGNGQRLSTYSEFVEAMKAEGLESAYLPICSLPSNGQLPTPCASN